MSSLEATTFSSVMPLMIGPMVTICAISSERAALPSRQRTEFANIRWRTLCTMRAIRTAMGSKAVSYTHLDVYKRQVYIPMAIRALRYRTTGTTKGNLSNMKNPP